MLKQQVALVTGASRGIGRAIALTLARHGAQVVVNYRSGEQEAQEVVAAIRAEGGQALALQGDVSSGEEAQALVDQTLEAFGRLDILINNAGITKDGLLLRMKEADFNQVIDVNLKGVFHCTRCVSQVMLKQKRGSIVNLTSVVGLSGNAGQSNYAAAKAGVVGFTKSVAKELAPRGIRVNAVAPGFIDTEMTQVLSDGVKEKALERIPLKRLGQAQEVADLVAFLVSSQATYITGQVISVDGGMYM